ncbi:MAG: phosphoribosylamine--glycine ligase [Candidatus Yonathbacteria bacterium RIFOXYC1_FULL_52_10]|uniref:Phosphoribosylamine--glycine ligase n=1 Tax=Candidatus Yonathbacteria bacterium RIFOXYD1_FULL_52_36 TaxID=1802730 RepID=A0A1G2SIT8_9BACT|nr:MAG: phosphoribosylamine--glycine ligase [Candidatus Yonathbacteria bacterium RIFOXYC1_FULL_52_10]OHA84930.1 MAG: phosphoribosylamine--glycine ligase [Candidatus Yonathbacteria bacterium RIFOXYD1_FULL_52_36]
MDILIVGEGGREHALVWKLKQSPKIKKIFVAPGNAGTAQLATNLPISSTTEIIQWLKENRVGLVLVGPDNYLAEGIVDKLHKLKIPAFGPTKKASRIEWSKVFAKNFMKEAGIPTARYKTFRNLDQAKKYIRHQTFPLVIKASGLAFGKGVIIAGDIKEAEEALKDILNKKVFGDAGNEVVIEEYLEGREISVHAFCDGNDFALFPSSKDHKRAFEKDAGPNTGGMGTIAPVPGVTRKQMQEISEKVIRPTLDSLRKQGSPFKGILFPGIMLTKEGPKVIEFNARFGDPETQVYMLLLKSDLLDILLACIKGDLKKHTIKWSKNSASCVVCVSGGYPSNYVRGKVIRGLNTPKNKNEVIFHAGTKLVGNKVFTNGGRILGVAGVGRNLSKALLKSYTVIKSISFDGMRYRKDIGSSLVR